MAHKVHSSITDPFWAWNIDGVIHLGSSNSAHRRGIPPAGTYGSRTNHPPIFTPRTFSFAKSKATSRLYSGVLYPSISCCARGPLTVTAHARAKPTASNATKASWTRILQAGREQPKSREVWTRREETETSLRSQRVK